MSDIEGKAARVRGEGAGEATEFNTHVWGGVRTIVFACVAVWLIAACAHQAERPAKLAAPAIEGRADLISPLDLEQIIRIAQHRLHVLLVFVPIKTVHVIDSADVDVFFHLPSKPGLRWLRLERSYGSWRIAEEHFE
jgi:hypothetical protein